MLAADAAATATVRSVFVIDSLQLTDSAKVATPVNWQRGDEVVILPAISNEEADALVPQGYRQLKPCLRLTQLEN